MLPEEKQEETANDLKMLVETATSPKLNRRWYSLSADGLLEGSEFVMDFTGNIEGTLKSLGKFLAFD